MSVNIVSKIQAILNYPKLEKVDPNTQELSDSTANKETMHRFAQSGISTILAAINNCINSDEGIKKISSSDLNSDWLNILFGSNKETYITRIAAYSDLDVNQTTKRLAEIATSAIYLIRQHAVPGHYEESIKKVIHDQRNNYYGLIPASIQVGELLKDDSIDDPTHKMEGPFSSIMHTLEQDFSVPESLKDAEKRWDSRD